MFSGLSRENDECDSMYHVNGINWLLKMPVMVLWLLFLGLFNHPWVCLNNWMYRSHMPVHYIYSFSKKSHVNLGSETLGFNDVFDASHGTMSYEKQVKMYVQ